MSMHGLGFLGFVLEVLLQDKTGTYLDVPLGENVAIPSRLSFTWILSHRRITSFTDHRQITSFIDFINKRRMSCL